MVTMGRSVVLMINHLAHHAQLSPAATVTMLFSKKIVTDRTLAGDIATLKRIAKEYPCKTIENVIAQLESRLSENMNAQNKSRRHKTTHI